MTALRDKPQTRHSTRAAVVGAAVGETLLCEGARRARLGRASLLPSANRPRQHAHAGLGGRGSRAAVAERSPNAHNERHSLNLPPPPPSSQLCPRHPRRPRPDTTTRNQEHPPRTPAMTLMVTFGTMFLAFGLPTAIFWLVMRKSAKLVIVVVSAFVAGLWGRKGHARGGVGQQAGQQRALCIPPCGAGEGARRGISV